MTDKQEWQQRILDDLGADAVDVELTPRQLDVALRRAIQTWNRFRPELRWLTLGDFGPTGTIIFTLTESEIGEIGVLDVEFADQDYPVVLPAALASTQTIMWGRSGPRIFFQYLVTERTMERFTGTQPDWYWEPDSRELYLYIPSRPVRVMALFSRPRTVESIRNDEEHQFEDLALAHAKIIAANILQQAGPVPGPHGSEISSNAETWRQEGQDKITALEEELKASVMSYAPPKWVG